MGEVTSGVPVVINRRLRQPGINCQQCGGPSKGYLHVNGKPYITCFSDECEDKISLETRKNRGKFMTDDNYLVALRKNER